MMGQTRGAEELKQSSEECHITHVCMRMSVTFTLNKTPGMHNSRSSGVLLADSNGFVAHLHLVFSFQEL